MMRVWPISFVQTRFIVVMVKRRHRVSESINLAATKTKRETPRAERLIWVI